MDKVTFLQSFDRKTDRYTLPNGSVVVLHELTAGQRVRVNDVLRNKPESIHVAVVAMALDFIDDDDWQTVEAIPGVHVQLMAEQVLRISGLTDEDAEKN